MPGKASVYMFLRLRLDTVRFTLTPKRPETPKYLVLRLCISQVFGHASLGEHSYVSPISPRVPAWAVESRLKPETVNTPENPEA